MDASKPAPGERRHLRLVHRGSGAGGRTVYGLAVGILWLAIVWLVFVSFVDTGPDDRTTPPGRSQPANVSNGSQYAPPTRRPTATTGG